MVVSAVEPVPVPVASVGSGGDVGTKSALQSEVLQHCVSHITIVRFAMFAVSVTF